MKTMMKIFTYVLMVFALTCISCTIEGEEGPIGPMGAQGEAGIDGVDGIDGADGINGVNGAGINEITIRDHNDNVLLGASSTLYRDKDGITAHFKTTNLIPNNAYTLWFVIFGDEPGPPMSIYAAGHIAGESGTEIFSAYKSVDVNFNNPQTAEVHMALRTHGPVQPGMLPSQIQTMDGGCTSGEPSGPSLYSDSDVVGYCANIQVGIHPPVN
ncbi:collagen-like protein [Aggregatimonas sangjinii]|uniref:Collagen-like protein n=1 Tax=Aggregatimonas sangjinii TaxID=2583587 RepID=A0A5B7SPJ1_9FLAO|nr:collagen-like protein [Aggregatimonas sangjinii]QCW98937.1 collagen-like protein [Aggregatimonas sangjinii]